MSSRSTCLCFVFIVRVSSNLAVWMEFVRSCLRLFVEEIVVWSLSVVVFILSLDLKIRGFEG